jgi:hypothetical protein
VWCGGNHKSGGGKSGCRGVIKARNFLWVLNGNEEKLGNVERECHRDCKGVQLVTL